MSVASEQTAPVPISGAAEAGAAVPDDRRRGIANLRRHTARGVLTNGAFDIGLIGLSALRGLVVAGFLTRSQYGIWGLLGLSMWTALGLKQQFGAGDKYVQQSEADQELAFQRAFTVEAIFAAAAAPVAAAIIVAFALISGHLVILAPGLTLLLMLPAIVLEFPVAAYYRQMDYRRQRTLQAVDPFVAAVVTIALAILGAGYWSFVFGVLAGCWAGAAVAVRACPYPLALRFDRATLRSYVGFSMPLLIAGVAGIVMFQVIFLVGNNALGLAGLGAFTLVGNFVQFTDQADNTVTQTLYPAVCAVRDRLELLADIFVKSNRVSLMWAVPFGAGLALFCSDLFRFAIGSKWLPAVHLMEIMGLVTAVHHVGYNWTAFFRARGWTAPIAWIAGVPVAVFIAAGVPLMYSDGLTGLGIAFAAGEVVGLIMRSVLLRRLFEGFELWRHLLRAFAPTVVAALPILLVRLLAGPEQSLGASIAAFLAYAALTIAATFFFERSLLEEAFGYLTKRRIRTA